MNTVARETVAVDGPDSPTDFFASGNPAPGLTRSTLRQGPYPNEACTFEGGDT